MADPEILKKGRRRQCISPVVIYHKCTQQTYKLFTQKDGILTKILSNRGRLPPPPPSLWIRHCGQGLTTTTDYSAASRSCSMCRTMQPELSSRHRGGPMPNRWCINYTAASSTQNCLHVKGVWFDRQHSEHVCTAVPQPTHQLPRQRMDTTLVSYATVATAHPTVHSYRLHETFFSMCRAVCLELTFCICHRKQLTVCIQI